MIKIIDNIINPTSQNRLETVINDRDFKWFYRRSATYKDINDIDVRLLNKDTAGFTCPVYQNGEWMDPVYAAWAWNILDNMTEETGIVVNDLIRVQFNLIYQHPNETTGDTWNSAHIDNEFDHNVLLYYVNDSDGDTVIFNEKRGDAFEVLSINERVSPKKGRAVLFDGNQYHASSNPATTLKRLTINFNFI